MAEKYLEMSPYNYAKNNPVIYVDPDGNEVEMCCDGLKGFIVGIVDNIASMNIRSKFEGQDFENGVKAADVVSAIGGAFLTAKGGGDIAAGLAGLDASATVTAGSGGLAIEATGPSAVVSGALVGVGTVEVYAGSKIYSNAMSNLNESGKIYKVPGEDTKSGEPYIGRTQQKSPKNRGGANAKDGRNRSNAEVIDTYDPSKKGQGAYKEQKAIDNNGGIKKLDNKRNEVSTERMKELKKKYGNDGK